MLTVHIVDIGEGGVLIAAPMPPDPGDTGTLRIGLASGSFVSDVEILHQTPAPAPAGLAKAGGAFRRMSDNDRRRLEQFVRVTT